MPVKILSEADTGDSTHAGGRDWNDISQWLNGVSNRIAPTINSITKFFSGKLVIGGVSNSALNNTIVGNADQTGDITFALPGVASGTHTIVARNSSDILLNKTIDARDNNLSGAQKFPSVRKPGYIAAGGVTGGGSGVGLLYGFVEDPATPTRGPDPTYGSYWRYSTTTTANTRTGVRIPARWILKEYLPYFRAKIRVSSVTSNNSRLYAGFSFQTQVPASDTPITNSESAVLVGWKSTDTNVAIYTNSGTTSSSSSPTKIDTGIAKTTFSNAVRQIEINFTGTNTCVVRLYDGNAASVVYTSSNITTNLPADAMAPSVNVSNTGSSNIDLDLFFCETDHK